LPYSNKFLGPSGHGKTELAKRMGELLSLELECIDCTELRHETDLFGPKKPYIGHELGSPLNNFLTRLNGRRSIVFLDEFEKTTKDVRNSLLIPFDEGMHLKY
jgi:ATP-dependent Clp protease ATP-binding subunit ClpA